MRNLNGMSGGELALHAFVISLRLAASVVGNAIRAFWSSITSTRKRKGSTLPGLSPKGIPGLQKFFDARYGNVVYFAPTAIESIRLNSRITTAIRTYEERCKRYMTTTVSAEDYERIRAGLIDGTLDPESITFADWLQVSFLNLYNAGEELHVEPKIVHKGNVYHLHTCVQGIVPAAPVESLKNKV